jgi:DNA-directed RNA polymerase specialized sigma subunit
LGKKVHGKLLLAGVEKIAIPDLVQADFEGLVNAGNSFEPSKESCFSDSSAR